MVRRPLPPAGAAAAAAGMDADSHSSNGREGATPPLAAPDPHPLCRLHGMAGLKSPAFPHPSKTTPRFVLLNPPWFAVIVLSILTVLLFLTTFFASPNPSMMGAKDLVPYQTGKGAPSGKSLSKAGATSRHRCVVDRERPFLPWGLGSNP